MRIQRSRDGLTWEMDPASGLARRAGGILSLALALLIVYSTTEGFRRIPWSFDPVWTLLLCLVTIAAAVYCILGRRHITLDARLGTLVEEWGLLVLSNRRMLQLKACAAVVVGKKERKTLLVSRVVYPVALAFAEGQIEIGAPARIEKAHELTEELARLLNVNVIDATADRHVVRAIDEIGKSFRERATMQPRENGTPPPPERMETRCDVGKQGLVFHFPMRGFERSSLWAGGIAAAVFALLAVAVPLAFRKPVPAYRDVYFYAAWTALFAFGAVTLILAAFSLSQAVQRTRLTVSPAGLEWRRRGPMFWTSKKLPVEQVEDILLPDFPADPPQRAGTRFLGLRIRPASETPGIFARGARMSFEFGQDLPEAELRWLHSVILKTLTT